MMAAINNEDMAAARAHVPVMVAEVREMLCASPPQLIVDATVGGGGHAAALLDAAPDARLLGLDRDDAALAAASRELESYGARATLRQADFGEIGAAMRASGFDRADAILADLGMSSLALDDPERGFSFRSDGPLDMRMDRRQQLRARDIVNNESERDLADLIYRYGEERASRKIARAIADARRRAPIETTAELRAIVERVLGPGRRGGISPATRTFQALRIAVNHELESLDGLLEQGPELLNRGGRMAVIAYHSLEDRAVKDRFRMLVRERGYSAVTRKPLRPRPDEVARNPRARSAKLRCIERAAQ